MRPSRTVTTIALILATNLVTLGFAQSARADVISTETAIQSQERTARIERITAVLERDSIQQQLVALGVEPADARQRVSSLSDSELQSLEQRMNDLPAGADGALTVLGIVLLVLLVLELVGVTDIFKSL
ncbi:MAG: PA2779 family protein [Woeseiaceae bacterium]